MSSNSSSGNNARTAIIVALITAISAIVVAIIGNQRLLDQIFSSPPQPTISINQPTQIAPISVTPLPSSNPSVEIQPTLTPASTMSCVLTISNGLVSLMSEADVFSQEIIRVKPGEYASLAYTEKTFVNQQQGWFQIEVEGRLGWIQNDTWTIADKTSGCP